MGAKAPASYYARKIYVGYGLHLIPTTYGGVWPLLIA